MSRISIIIPVFNTNHHLLNKCIESIKKQTYQDFEVILIDDGSEEQTKQYLRFLSETIPNSRCFFKDNGGAASARALGVSLSDSELIAFIDSDDEVFPSYLEEAVSYIDSGFDIAVGGFVNYYQDAPSSVHKADCELLIRGRKEIEDILSYYVSSGCPRKYSCLRTLGGKALVSKLYKRTLFEKIDCLENDLTFGEDVLVNIEAIMNAESVAISEHSWYRRNINLGSISYSYHDNGIVEAFNTAEKIAACVKSREDLSINLEDALKTFILSSLNLGLISQVFHPDAPTAFREKYHLLKSAMKRADVIEACKSCNFDKFERSGTWDLIRIGVNYHLYLLAALVYFVRSKRQWW